MLLKLLGETQENSPLTKAIAVSAPMQLELCANSVNHGFSKFYQHILIKDLKQSLHKKYDMHDMRALLKIKRKEIHNIKTFWEFDAAYTAPIHGFTSAQDYYTKNSARVFLKDIRTPTLIIHALDDPFMSPEVLPHKNELSEYITLEVSENGGHVGFIGGSIFKPKFWLEERIVEFF